VARDALQCRRHARLPHGRDAGGQLGEHGGQMPTGQSRQLHLPDRRDQVGLDVMGVGAQRGRPDRRTGGQPVAQPPPDGPTPPGELLARLLEHLRPSPAGRRARREPTPADLLRTTHRSFTRQRKYQLPCPRSPIRPHPAPARRPVAASRHPHCLYTPEIAISALLCLACNYGQSHHEAPQTQLPERTTTPLEPQHDQNDPGSIICGM
jgi:hypothetical protein